MLSGAEATWAEFLASVSLGCFVKEAEQLNLKETEVPENALGTVQHVEGETLSHDGYMLIEFDEIDDQQTIHCGNFGSISVLSLDHVFVSECGKISLVSDEALLQKRAQ